ncbi:hypothetical protein FEMY_22750 [Ferrovum myxofaciens]|uniref:Uncharacterized protein n=1 Tax=Ferrovum myxofaciens TaxID=416213 RepID=A0A149VVG0_9PROT|nr:hypothetical protein FEMY_22750 [Ferrovum myxofaciens]
MHYCLDTGVYFNHRAKTDFVAFVQYLLKQVPDYVSISVRAISFFPEQGVAHMSATASLGTIAARSNCCISGNQSTVDRNDSPHRFSQEVRILCIHTVFQYALR